MCKIMKVLLSSEKVEERSKVITHTPLLQSATFTPFTPTKNNQSHLSDDFGDFDHFGDDLTAEFTITLAQDESFQIRRRR